jgi:hypothetical protein
MSKCSILASHHSELTLSQSKAQRQDIFQCTVLGLHRNESSRNSKSEAAKEWFPSSTFSHQTSICLSAVVGSQYRATTVAAESLIAQLDSQGKLTMPRRENKKKLDMKTKFKSQTNTLRMCRNFRSIDWYQKHMCKSRETIPLLISF